MESDKRQLINRDQPVYSITRPEQGAPQFQTRRNRPEQELGDQVYTQDVTAVNFFLTFFDYSN